jgi:cysteine desulfurase/selenocysteine lyase
MFDIDKVRSDFPILGKMVYGKKLVYLDNAATTQKPRAVIEKIVEFYSESNSNIHRGAHYLSEMASGYYENAREAVKKFVNAKCTHEIVFTHGTTESINIVAHCFGSQRLKEGDEIIITEMEHHSNLVPWQIICKQKAAILKVVPFNNDGKLQIEALKSLVNEKTALIAVTYVSNVLGVVNPVKEIVTLGHSYNVPVLIDAAQAVQHKSIDVIDLDCDFLVFSGHKMYAETGIGVLYGKEKWLDLMSPYQYGGGMIAQVDFKRTTFAGLPYKFEAGTPNIAGAISIASSIDYINKIGIDEISSHEQSLLQHAVKQLSSLEGVELYGAGEQQCGVVSFNIRNVGAYDAAMILDKMGIALRSGHHCAEPVMKHFGISGTVRASFALYNTIDEIIVLTQGVKRVQSMLL